MTMFPRTNSEGGWMRWGYLKPTLILIGLLMILSLAPVSNASQPQSATYTGEWSPTNFPEPPVQRGQGKGPLSINMDTVLDFVSGGVDGEMTGSLTLLFRVDANHITVTTSGVFVGTIGGSEPGTAKFHSVVEGERFNYRGPINFYDGTGGLEGINAKGFFTRDGGPPVLPRYSLDVIFR